jgi:hypothetical protein
VTSVTSNGTLSAGADFFAGQVDAAGGLVGYGCVFDYFDDLRPPGTDFLHPGVNQPLARLMVTVLATEDTTATLSFQEVFISPQRPVRNVMTNEHGFSEMPETVNLTVNIETRRPRILSASGNSGLAGALFSVTGDFFGEPGLAVRVCNTPAQATLQADGVTLAVTAPPCATRGFAPLQVCTVRGCDSRDDGFFYEEPPPPAGKFKRGDCNGDGEVSGVVTDAVFMLNFNFLGGPDPPCAAACDANGDGAFPGTVTDAVYVLNFNFLGGPPPRPPYPECDPGTSSGDLGLGCRTPLSACGL